jgi:alkaline phosphatase D
MKRHLVRNVVWLTADVHYTAAHRYEPSKAQFTDFDPFWEFISGPLNAGTFGPGVLENTFGPQVAFYKAPPKGLSGMAPTAGLQFFGEVEIDGRSGEMTVRLKDLTGSTLFTQRIEPQRQG